MKERIECSKSDGTIVNQSATGEARTERNVER